MNNNQKVPKKTEVEFHTDMNIDDPGRSTVFWDVLRDRLHQNSNYGR